jgi:phosphoglycerate kinase
MTFIRMTDLDLNGKRVLIREDLNVPIQDGKITSTQRLDAALPTIRGARDAGAAVLVMSHLGRPKEGVFDEAQSLKPVAAWVTEKLGTTLRQQRNYVDGDDA